MSFRLVRSIPCQIALSLFTIQEKVPAKRSQILQNTLPQNGLFPFNIDHYNAAVPALGLVLMQEVPQGTQHSEVFPEFTIGGHHDKGDRGSGFQTANFLVTQSGEGAFKFTTLQASIEDAIGE